MARMKDYLYDKIKELAGKAGCGFDEVMARFLDYERECREDGVPVDWRYFAGVTLEGDW